MLLGLGIRDLVLIESLELSFGPGLTVLSGETGAGKSIILDALGLATGRRADVGLIRAGAASAVATAVFHPPPGHAAWLLLEDRGLPTAAGEPLVLRRAVGQDGRSRAFLNDQAVAVGLLRDLGDLLVEVHGQHETVGLLDARSHRGLLDAYGRCGEALTACETTWRAWRSAQDRLDGLTVSGAERTAEREELERAADELDRLAPRPAEEAALAEERRLLAAAEKTLEEIDQARRRFGDDAVGRAAQALRALERARDRLHGAVDGGPALNLLSEACAAAERAVVELTEAGAAIDAAANALIFEPDHLERTEERLFALRAAARKLGVPVDALAQQRALIADRLRDIEDGAAELARASAALGAAASAYAAAAVRLSAERRAAADGLAAAVRRELAPLKLERARFRVNVDSAFDARPSPTGLDRVEFEIATLPDAPFAPLAAIASGGELARLALALKACLAERTLGAQPVMVFDEVDQGVGGAVADAVGVRLKRLAEGAQVLVVTHSPQVAARAETHWRVGRSAPRGEGRTEVEALGPLAREEEIARMLSGARVSDAARAAARALIHA